MTKEQKPNRREVFRVALNEQARVRKVAYHETDLFRTKKEARGQLFSTISPASARQFEPYFMVLSDMIETLEEKLDRVIRHFVQPTDDNDTSIHGVLADLSATGARILVDETIEKGEILYIAIRIPGFPFGQFETLGEVIHTQVQANPASEHRGLYAAGIEFYDLTEAETELLIAYVFEGQRKNIRQAD